MSFKSLEVIEPILQALEDEGYSHPTPIQSQAIPIVLQKKDLLACAQTGTGKTAAFAIPILQLLAAKPKDPKRRKVKCLVLTPTRELAIQIGESFAAYGKNVDLLHTVIFGGVGQNPQVNAIRNGIDILIATPGRLLDIIQQGFLSLHNVELFVLDEADRMLDMGFIHDVKRLLTLLPEKKQSLFFSATMPNEIVKLANTILKNPSKVAVTPVSSTVEIIQQYIYFVDKGNKQKLLLELLKNEAIKTVLVFTRTKHGADKVVKVLIANGITAEAIHGNKAQNARQRALTNFKNQTTRVLVATDIAARGIDVDGITHVINYELPDDMEVYTHRSGRTARAGKTGVSIALILSNELQRIYEIEKDLNIKFTETTV